MRNPIISILCAAAVAAALASCSVIVKEKETPCGNGQIEGLEECDRGNFGDETCESLGYPGGGHLICTSYCRIDEHNCAAYWVGDNTCDDDESPEWSPDCGDRQVRCGDDICDPSENIDPSMGGCEADCYGIVCGDGWCDRPAEYEGNCGQDCGSAAFCGDSICQEWEDEAGNCPDCGDVICGNQVCEEGETWESCPQDCGVTTCNQNAVCEPEMNENADNCVDCYEVPDCGNTFCDSGENPENCPADCGMIGCYNQNGICNAEAGETESTCEDCQGLPGCGDFSCEDPEYDANCPFDCSMACNQDGKCQPELGEFAPNCQDCSGLVHCGNGVCDQGEGETSDSCQADCGGGGSCGDGTRNGGEVCDGGDLGGQDCSMFTNQRGEIFQDGYLGCYPDCQRLDTWGCLPRDLGAPCESVADCGTEAGLICVTTAAGNFCSASCSNPGNDCDLDPGTTCVQVNQIGVIPDGNYCLRRCMSAQPYDCPQGFACDNLGGLLGTQDYCHPPVGGM